MLFFITMKHRTLQESAPDWRSIVWSEMLSISCSARKQGWRLSPQRATQSYHVSPRSTISRQHQCHWNTLQNHWHASATYQRWHTTMSLSAVLLDALSPQPIPDRNDYNGQHNLSIGVLTNVETSYLLMKVAPAFRQQITLMVSRKTGEITKTLFTWEDPRGRSKHRGFGWN